MFSERLKALRKEAGFTQKEMAQQFGISQQAYATWENGQKMPAKERLAKLANFFNVSIDYLLGNSDNKKSNEADLSMIETLYQRTSRNLTEEEQKLLEEELKKILLKHQQAHEEKKKKGWRL